MELLDTTVLETSEDITWRDADGEIVALTLTSGNYYTFNELGREIWLSLTQQQPVGKIIEGITSEYDIDHETAEKDVKNFIQGLIAKDILLPQE